MSAIWLKSAVAGSESSISDRLTIDCGCFAASEAVTGAISFALVAVTTMSEPSAIPACAVWGSGSVAGAGSTGRDNAAAATGAVSLAQASPGAVATNVAAPAPSRRARRVVIPHMS